MLHVVPNTNPRSNALTAFLSCTKQTPTRNELMEAYDKLMEVARKWFAGVRDEEIHVILLGAIRKAEEDMTKQKKD